MGLRVAVWWESVRTGLWSVLLVVLPLAVLLHRGALALDETNHGIEFLRTWGLYSGSGDDARNLLSTLVTSLITMSSLVFSITVVTLTLASNQFGSRIVRTYLADLRTKVALGTFSATIVYCLLALRSVHKDMPVAEVPHLTVSVGLLLALLCVIALLLFLHVIARSIVADQVIRRVAEELETQIAALPPLDEEAGRPAVGGHAEPGDSNAEVHRLRSREEGYVQTVDYESIADVAARHDVRVNLDFKPGVFICQDDCLGTLLPASRVTEPLEHAIRKHIVTGERRTAAQDLEFSIRHLIDIALRALSPGINDTNTALVVIDRLRGALSRIFGKQVGFAITHPQGWRVRFKHDRHEDVIDTAFNQIRQSASANPAALIRLLQAQARLSEHVRTPEQREALLRQARMVATAARAATGDQDRRDVEAAAAQAESRLRGA